ncbi:uncharacterized protein J7T54_002721 [Emericellopsis cladophorae]|uniref:Receptor L-domain domain-containing protein n=1 Tax=Emericellopsis cladophorae TaxID=2686198 RepID=A0A9P9XV10_9HYPO|nr:uncharacterized protein J7T54_002721 [Emericellopsis cladophorae]KAI6778186.1 hypothetical protein J7T54_002721 [Emericellopsis cladophorae]
MERIATALLLTLALTIGRAGLALAQDCEKEIFRIGIQEDADALINCATLTGDVVIAATAKGSIDLDGIEKIDGNLSNEACFDSADDYDNDRLRDLLDGDFDGWKKSCRGLVELSSNTLTYIEGAWTLRALVDIASINFKKLKVLDGVPDNRMTSLNIDGVDRMTGKFHSVELVDLGISEWPAFRLIKIQDMSTDTLDTPDFDNPIKAEGRMRIDTIVAKDLPNISLFQIRNSDEIGLLEVHGRSWQTIMLEAAPRSDLSTSIEVPTQVVGNLTMTGIGQPFNFTFGYSGLSINTLHMVNNTMRNINLENVIVTDNLYIAGNRNLTQVRMFESMVGVEFDSIVFEDNPNLLVKLDSFGNSPLHGWAWGFNASILAVRDCPVGTKWFDFT